MMDVVLLSVSPLDKITATTDPSSLANWSCIALVTATPRGSKDAVLTVNREHFHRYISLMSPNKGTNILYVYHPLFTTNTLQRCSATKFHDPNRH